MDVRPPTPLDMYPSVFYRVGLRPFEIPALIADEDWTHTTAFRAHLIAIYEVDWTLVDLSRAACVARGLRHLQLFYPHLLPRIPIEDVFAVSPHMDALAHCVGDTQRSIEAVIYGPEFMVAHGFQAPKVPDVPRAALYAALTVAWREALTVQRAA